VSYTLTFATLHAPGAPSLSDPFERRHQLSTVASYDLGAGFRAGGRFVFYTGAPFTTTTAFESNGGTVSNEWINPSTLRPSPFWRLDARVEKRWSLSQNASVGVALEWLNATLNREHEMVCRVSNTLTPDPPACHEALRPLLSAPSLTLFGQL
jgi:hypothetical protein